MAVKFDHIAVGYGNASALCYSTDVVAAEIEQHQMFGALLWVGEQRGAVLGVFDGRFSARASASYRTDGHFAAARANQYFGRRTDDGKAGQVEEVKKRRRVDPTQCAVEIDRR